jgi:hypothetical protein
MKRSGEMKRKPMARGAGISSKVPTAEPKVRMRKCAVPACRAPFTPRSMTHKCCGPECAEVLVKIERDRAARKERQEGLAKLKRRVDWMREAQTAFNAFVRCRDELAGLPCVSCGRHHQGQNHAGHFLSVGAHPAHRFNEINVWLQCQPCNVHLSGNALNYRRELVRRIGVEALELLETDTSARKYSVQELQEIKTTYVKKLKELRAGRAQIQHMTQALNSEHGTID